MGNKKKNNLKITVSSIFIIVIVISIVIGVYLLQKKEKLIGTYIDDTTYDNQIFKDQIDNSTGTGEMNEENIKIEIEKENKKQEQYGKISSIIRTLCSTFKNTKSIVNSQTFGMLKKEIISISNELESSKDNFTYVVLPGLVFKNCKNDNDAFTNNLLKLLQHDGEQIVVSTKDEINGVYKLVSDIKFVGENIDKNKIKQSNKYLDEIIFDNNFSQITKTYFFQNIYYLGDLDKYTQSSPSMTFTESSILLESSVQKFQDFIKDLGFNNLADFRKTLLSLNGYSDLEALTNDLLKKYAELNNIAKDELDFYLNEELVSIDSLKKFYVGENFKKMTQNEKAKKLYEDISLGHIYFAIINGDYADDLTETWSGKELFGDGVKGNGIIRLSYLYMYDNNK